MIHKKAGVPQVLENIMFDKVMNYWHVKNIIFEMVVDIKKTMNLAFRASNEENFDCEIIHEHEKNLTDYLSKYVDQWDTYLDSKAIFLTSKQQKFNQVVLRATQMMRAVSREIPKSAVIEL